MKTFNCFLIFSLLLALVAVSGYLGFMYFNNAPSSGRDDEYFDIREGDTVISIAERLEKQGLIKKALFFRMLSKVKDTERSFKVGTYRITGGTDAKGIHDLFVSGKQVLYKVTFPEGLTISRMGEILEKEGITARNAFVKLHMTGRYLKESGPDAKTAQGFLYPDLPVSKLSTGRLSFI